MMKKDVTQPKLQSHTLVIRTVHLITFVAQCKVVWGEESQRLFTQREEDSSTRKILQGGSSQHSVFIQKVVLVPINRNFLLLGSSQLRCRNFLAPEGHPSTHLRQEDLSRLGTNHPKIAAGCSVDHHVAIRDNNFVWGYHL